MTFEAQRLLDIEEHGPPLLRIARPRERRLQQLFMPGHRALAAEMQLQLNGRFRRERLHADRHPAESLRQHRRHSIGIDSISLWLIAPIDRLAVDPDFETSPARSEKLHVGRFRERDVCLSLMPFPRLCRLVRDDETPFRAGGKSSLFIDSGADREIA